MSLLATPTFSGTGTNDTFYVKIGGSTSGGVSTLNGLSGTVAIAGDAGVGVSAAGSTVQLATVGRPVSASSVGGAWAGTTVGYNSSTQTTVQCGNMLLGNTRIQWGFTSGTTTALGTVNVALATAYPNFATSAAVVYVCPQALLSADGVAGYATDGSNIQVKFATKNSTAVFFSWMTIGAAV